MSRDGGDVVGRATARARIEDARHRADDGTSRVLLVSGTAGIGKTTLLRTVLSDSSSAVAWGTCWHGEGAPGFWPWMQAADAVVEEVGFDAAVTAAGEERSHVGHLARRLRDPADTGPVDARQRLLLLDASTRWFWSLADERPLTIVLDDLQWADDSTLDLLDYLLSAPSTAPLLVIGAYRHDDLDDRVRERLSRAISRSDHLRLEGLTIAEVAQLAGDISGVAIDHATVERLHQRTGGHPLFVRELAALPAGDRATVPTAVASAIVARLERLPSETYEALEVASVVGNRVSPPLIAGVLQCPEAQVVERLRSAIRADVVLAAPPSGLRFAHDLFRESVYGQLEPLRREEYHASLATVLADRRQRGGDISATEIARHGVAGISTLGWRFAIEWARAAAAEERPRAAFAEAADHLRRARDAAIAGGDIDANTVVDTLREEADDRASAGDATSARMLLERAARLAPDPRSFADVALATQRLGAQFASRRDALVSLLSEARDRLGDDDVERSARVTAALAREYQHSVHDERQRAAQLSEDALELGRRAGDRALIDCLLARHDVVWRPGTGTERAAIASEIVEVAERVGDVDRRAEGLLLSANGLLEAGSPRFAIVLDEWFRTMEARRPLRDRYMVQTRRAALALLDGPPERAEALIDEAARLGEQIREPDAGNVRMSQRVALAYARQQPSELLQLADDAVAHWTGAPVLAHGVAAGAAAMAGDLDRADSELALVDAAGGWDEEGSYLRSVLVALLAEATTALGHDDLSLRLLREITPLTDDCGVNGAVVAFAGPFAYPAALLHRSLGHDEQARTLFARASAVASGLGARVWVERSSAALATPAGGDATNTGSPTSARLHRSGDVWTAIWDGEEATLTHRKGLADLAVLLARPRTEVPALDLLSGSETVGPTSIEMTDVQALRTYRRELARLGAEIDEAREHGDLGRLDRLEDARDQIATEVRRATGLGGRIRTSPNDPAERARKAVSARIRDAIARVGEHAPRTAALLDRSIRTGLRCSYDPRGRDADVRWEVG